LPGAAELLKENTMHSTSPQRASLPRRSEHHYFAAKEPKKIEFYRTLQKPTEMKGRHV